MNVSPRKMAAAYELLRNLQPFSRWKLPPASEVRFGITRAKDTYGICQRVNGRHRIWAKRRMSMMKFLETMAHEMCHMREDAIVPQYSGRTYRHGEDFKKLAEQVCKALGFNPSTF